MRMPGRNGVDLLAEVAERWPNTQRILLTAFADLDDAVDAINRASIFQYLNKPWQEDSLRLTINRAMELHVLNTEKLRLERLTAAQNHELAELNHQLEQRVQARTPELQQTADMLDIAYEELHESFTGMVQALGNVIELREGRSAGHALRFSQLARKSSEPLNLPKSIIDDIYYAALLHEIGMTGMPDRMSTVSISTMDESTRSVFNSYPALGQTALVGLRFLQSAAAIIRSHRDRFDGRGQPDGLKGGYIPLGARIVAIAKAYDAAQLGLITGKLYSPEEAFAYVQRGSGSLFDPALVDLVARLIKQIGQQQTTLSEKMIHSDELRAGMTLSRDLFGPNNMLLLSEGHRVGDSLIDSVRKLEKSEEMQFDFYIQIPKR
jgi:response regulator RpfG family c-di-GMP phosphodiesterase